jgi:hypothetical protein
MVFSKLRDLVSSEEAEKSDSSTVRDFSEVTVEVRYHAKSSQYIVVYHPPTDNHKYGFGDSLRSAFKDIHMERFETLTAEEEKQVKISEPVDIDTSLTYSDEDGNYTLTLSRPDISVSGSGGDMTTTFRAISQESGLDELTS